MINFSIQQAKELHRTGQAQKLHGTVGNGLLKAAVYGANDGIVTTFAVAAGAAGAGLPASVVLVLGIGNMIADALSMGIGDFLGERSERRHLQQQYAIEQWEVKNIPEEERKELKKYFADLGVSKEDQGKLTTVITKYPRLWANLGFTEEMGVAPVFDGVLWHSGFVTFISFIFAGALPLLPYLLLFFGLPIPSESLFQYSILATAITLFFVGSLRTLMTKGRWWWNGLEMLCIGAIAAVAAYGVGSFLEKVI